MSIVISENMLRKAWQKLKKSGRTAQGTDNLLIEDISDSNRFILSIFDSILSKQYEPDPVRTISIPKNNGEKREISILTLKDHLVHIAIKDFLEPLCEPLFAENSFAYRPKRSALQAVGMVENWINEGNCWVGETDIQNFFENVNHEILIQQIYKLTENNDLIELIETMLHSTKGILQGSPLSPLLSNLYLNEFDHYISSYTGQYVRFADDLLFMATSKEKITYQLEKAINALRMLKLSINGRKTNICEVSDSFIFLGYQFDSNGKATSKMGKGSLLKTLSLLEEATTSSDDLIIKSEQVIRGWSQYYTEIPWLHIKNKNILLLAPKFTNDKTLLQKIYDQIISLLSFEEVGNMEISSLIKFSTVLQNKVDTCFWIAISNLENKVYYYNWIEELTPLTKNDKSIFFSFLRSIAKSNDYHNEVSEFNDWLLYEEFFPLAKLFQDFKPVISFSPKKTNDKPNKVIDMNEVYNHFHQLFSGKEDMHLIEKYDNGKRTLIPQSRPWNLDDINKHLTGQVTIAQYIIRSNKTVNYAVIDVDVVKIIADQYKDNTNGIERYKKIAFEDTMKIYKVANEKKIDCYIEDSGFRGYHIWFFFDEPVPLKIAFEFLTTITSEAGNPSEHISWELFPKQRKIKDGQRGQAIKLPLGKHVITNLYSNFIDKTRVPMLDQNQFLLSIKRINLEVVYACIGKEEGMLLQPNKIWSNNILKILDGCSIVKHFCEKAKNTKYLTHQERLFLLNVFGPMDSEGHDYLHYIISHTLNYEKNITERFILKRYDKPISCVRIREHFPQLTSQLSCNCRFNVEPNLYPSPVRHAINKIAVKNQTQEEHKNIPDMSINQKQTDINNLTKRLIELRKQQRGVTNSIQRVEKEIQNYFEREQINEVEIEYGKLVKVDRNEETIWVIEL